MSFHKSDRAETFVELFSLHQRSVYGFIYTLVPNAADAEDLLQTTSVVMWRKFQDFEIGGDFRAWACRIAHFEVLNFLKSKRRSRVCFNDELISKLAEVRAARADVLAAEHIALMDCIKGLNSSDRHLVNLCFDAGYGIKAAARELERPVESVYTSLSRIRGKLLDCIRRTVAREER